MCLEMVSRISCPITFPGIEMRLVGLYFPRSFLPFLKTGVTFAFLQSLGTSASHYDRSKIIKSFPNFTLGAWTMFLYSSQVIWPCFHPLYASFFCVCVWPGLLAHPHRPPGIFDWFLIPWGSDSWILTSFCRLLLPLGPHPMGLCWADIWRGRSLLSCSWSLWACFSPCSIPSGSWTPSSHSHCSQGCLWSSHPQWGPPFWRVWGPAKHLSLLAPQSLVGRSSHQRTPGISWIAYAPLCSFSNSYEGVRKPSWGPGSVNVRLFLSSGTCSSWSGGL